jgi:uroporphyrinogen decarboxylase
MRDPARFSDVAEDARVFKAAGFVPTGAIQGFFAGIHNSFMNFTDTLANLLLAPAFMQRLIGRLARMSLDAVQSYIERGVEVITICDDLGTAGGLLMSPELFRRFFLPWYEELVRLVHAHGRYLHLHSHGNIAAVLPDLAGAGIDIINPFDWSENPDLPDLVRRFGDRIVFCGGSVPDLSLFDLEEVTRITRRACSLARIASRGYMFMGNPGMEHLSTETWRAWREIFAREREQAIRS